LSSKTLDGKVELAGPEHVGFVFVLGRGGPMNSDGVRKMTTRTGEEMKLPFPVHSHMLRHARGFKLANDGHDTRALQLWLGHRNVQHPVQYDSRRVKTVTAIHTLHPITENRTVYSTSPLWRLKHPVYDTKLGQTKADCLGMDCAADPVAAVLMDCP
jgi:site-specific recombinase XerD